MNKIYLYGGAALVGAGVLYFMAKKTGDGLQAAAGTVGGWLNPTADTNLAYRGVNAVGSSLTGDPDFTLGGWIYDKKQEADATRAALGVSPWAMFIPPVAIGQAIGGAVAGVWNSTNINAAALEDVRQIDRITERQAAQYAALDQRYAGAAWGDSGGATGSW